MPDFSAFAHPDGTNERLGIIMCMTHEHALDLVKDVSYRAALLIVIYFISKFIYVFLVSIITDSKP
jgi:hypothetical protein